MNQPRNDEFAYDNQDYAQLRRPQAARAEVVIPYKPVEEPAWDKHTNGLGPKPARFSKLHNWDQRGRAIHSVVRWAVVAAGAATVAAPAIMHVVH